MSVLTLIIGLERNYRGETLEHQLQKLGIASERSAGVEGEYNGVPVSSYANDDEVRVLYGRSLRIGEIGCALAHRDCYRRLLSSDADWALIFEDDARIVRPEAMAEVMKEVESRPPFETPAIIMLYGRQMVGDPRFRKRLADGTEIAELLRTPMTATAYFINRAAAAYILDTGLPLRNTADWPVSVEGNVRFAGVYPWIAIPDETGAPSSIGSRGGARSAMRKLKIRLEAGLLLKWLKHRAHYRSFQEYRDWEIRRRFVHLALGRKHPYRVSPQAKTLPTSGRFALTVDRLLGGRRDARLVSHLTSDAVEGRRTP